MEITSWSLVPIVMLVPNVTDIRKKFHTLLIYEKNPMSMKQVTKETKTTVSVSILLVSTEQMMIQVLSNNGKIIDIPRLDSSTTAKNHK